MLARELLQLRPPRHAAVIVHDLAQDPGGLEPGELTQVDRRLGVSGAHQDPAAARAQGEDVPRTREVCRLRVSVGEGADGGGAIGRGDPGGGAGTQVDRDREGGAVRFTVHRDHLWQVQTRQVLLGHRHADNAARVADHERHRLRRRVLGGHDEVALVLPVLVIHDDDHAPGAQLREDLPQGAQGGSGAGRGSLSGQWQDFGHGRAPLKNRPISIPEWPARPCPPRPPGRRQRRTIAHRK
jgi:hypothetical protein